MYVCLPESITKALRAFFKKEVIQDLIEISLPNLTLYENLNIFQQELNISTYSHFQTFLNQKVINTQLFYVGGTSKTSNSKRLLYAGNHWIYQCYMNTSILKMILFEQKVR